MSSDPQWKTFQPSAMDSDTSILDCKSLSSVMPSHGSSNGSSYNSGNQYSYHHKDNNMYSNRLHDGSYYNYNTWGGGGGSGGGGGGGGGGSCSGGGGNGGGSGSGSNSSASTFSIGTFTGREGTEIMNGDSSPSSNNSYNQSHSNNADGSFQRETGIIEKLLHSYGFIQCCERQARLFFHFSQFNGNIEHLKIGDPVEFEMTYDRRTGKPIASFVSKIAPEVVLSEERVTGNVTTEIRADGSGENQGRISYENRGECFFLPYNKEDVEGNVTLCSGDKVSFQIAANQRGNLGASHVRLENAVHPVKYQGVVCTMKESFGFIERADIVKEIFFHFSESSVKRDLQLGDDVEFTIQTRNGKEVACGITLLTPGSVIFEDVCDELMRGQVLKPLERGQQARHQNDPLPGRIKYRAADHSEVEVPFGEKDQKGDFTLRHGDWVEFHLATDRRDGLKRATRISLLDDSFVVSGERREQGTVSSVKDCFGFIRCVEREQELFFRFHEILDVDRVEPPAPGDEVEFTMVPDSTSSFSQNRQNAIRIKYLPPNTVKFENVIKEKVPGNVTADVVNYNPRSPTKSQANGKMESGQITYLHGDTKKTINYYQKDCDTKNMPKLGDKVEFDIAQVKWNRKMVAMNVRVKQRAPDNEVQHNGKSHRDAPVHRGFIAALKDGYGFIENITHDNDVFFHYSQLDGDATKLSLGLEVEYNIGSRGNSGSWSAENVRLLPRGTFKPPDVHPDVLNGKIVRTLRGVNPEQESYAGIVEANSETDGEKGEQYEYGITSLENKKELLQVGDPVTFQVDVEGRAANIAAIRKKRRSTVDLVKPQFGFLTYEVEEGKKLFFHTSEVKDNVQLQAGDTVEFVLVTNQRTGKSSACNVTKVSENIQRPERLISRLRTTSVDDSGPKTTVTRQPKGPDSTKGFNPAHRQPRQAGILLE